eukprot:5322855-Pleurochrysis_carterae.AAC.2
MYAAERSDAKKGASAASIISSRNMWRMASLNRWAIFEAGCVPKPRRRSETKKSKLPSPSETRAGVLSGSDSWMNAMFILHHSSGAIANWLK